MTSPIDPEHPPKNLAPSFPSRGIGLATKVVLGAIAGYIVATGTAASGFKTLEAMVLGAVLYPIGWLIGRTIGNLCTTTIAGRQDAIQFGLARVGHSVLPLGFAIAGGLASLSGVAKIIDNHPTPTVAAATSSAAPSKAAAMSVN